MKRSIAVATLAAVAAGCVSLTAGGKNVQVYQADLDSPEAAAPPLPGGCRLLGTSGPIEEVQETLEQSDPYRTQRNDTAALGGNVLYLQSYLFRRLLKTDCPIGATAASGCENNAQNWYRVTFRSYACDEAALAELAESPEPITPSIFRINFGKKKAPAPAVAAAAPPPPAAVPPAALAPATAEALKARILDLMHSGVGADVVVAYVRTNRPGTALTADEIIDWKKSGIPDEVIRATFPN